jgi:hypothetical protein
MSKPNIIAIRVLTLPRAMKIIRLFTRKRTRLPVVYFDLEQLDQVSLAYGTLFIAGTPVEKTRIIESEITIKNAVQAGELYKLTITRDSAHG